MNFFMVLFVWISALLVNAQGCTRTRRSWEALNGKEKRAYKDAIASAMESGAYIKFVELHTEMMSEREAHNNCMFLYWHRLMLLAYENMLRAQGPQFACVTVPYFDYVSAHARFSSGECDSIGSCSPILNGLGGVPSGSRSKSLAINGLKTKGFCVSEKPLNSFCESTSACREGNGARCVPRGGWGKADIPASASFASLQNQIFQASDIAEVSSNIEQGLHNNIHATLQGAMENFTSPADPIFYSHHATVDLFHTIFHSCKVGTGRLTAKQKARNPVAWNSCRRRDNGRFHPDDQVMMRVGEQGVNPTIAWEDPQLAPFFQDVPTTYASLMDTTDLGYNSYQYEVSGLLAMLSDCSGQSAKFVVHTGRRLMESDTPASKETIFSTSTLSSPSSSKGAFKTAITPRTNRSISAKITSAIVVVNGKTEKAVELTSNWLKKTEELIKQTVGETANSATEIERMQCMFQEECLGGIQDYSEAFKKNFGITEPPRCRKILDDMKKKNQSICKIGWRDIMGGYFGCPTKTKKTSRSPYTS